MTPTTRHTGATKTASTINMLAGIWLFVSPWVYGAYTSPVAWNSWIIGAVIIILAATRISHPLAMTWVSWVNCILGIWTFASPWIYGFTGNTAWFINTLVLGVIVFILSITSASSTPHSVPPSPTHA